MLQKKFLIVIILMIVCFSMWGHDSSRCGLYVNRLRVLDNGEIQVGFDKNPWGDPIHIFISIAGFYCRMCIQQTINPCFPY